MPLAAGAAGCFAGDVIWYATGRWYSQTVMNWRIVRVVGPRVERIATRIGPWQIAASRVLYGTRTVTMLFWRIRRLAFARFTLIDIPSCAARAALLGMLGYSASAGAMLVLGEVKRVEFWLLGSVVICVVGFLAVKFACALARRASGGES